MNEYNIQLHPHDTQVIRTKLTLEEISEHMNNGHCINVEIQGHRYEPWIPILLNTRQIILIESPLK